MRPGTVILRWALLSDFAGRFDRLETRLSPDERARAQRLRIEAARHRLILARTLLRSELGAILGVEPRRLEFEVAERGKPFLTSPSPPSPPGFNLSHSGDVVVVAIALGEIGVDVERLRRMTKAERLARRFFGPAEFAAVQSSPETARDHLFLRIWTQKEAYLKATGLGVGMPLREVETEPDPTRPVGLRAVSGDRREAARWSLTEVEVPGAVCVVALETQLSDLDVRRINSLDDLLS